MNLELPFYQLPDAELDAYLERIDQQLDALFLDAVSGAVETLRVERSDSVSDSDQDVAAA